jgi:YegS/Rv2252/BmrU family lipid kinase
MEALLKTLLFIFNPATGGGQIKASLMDILCLFSAAGYALNVWPTQASGDARRIARAQAPLADIVVCCGGDGTLSEVVDGLTAFNPMPLVGYIPCGTTCDFAASLLLPKQRPLAAAQRVLRPGKIYRCDIGLFNRRAFTYVAGFGAFTDVSYQTSQTHKNLLGYFAYMLEGMQRLPNLKPSRVRVECAQGVFEDDYLLGMVTNSAAVAGFTFPGKKKVRLDDGLFELLLVRYPQNIAQLGDLSAAFLTGDDSSPLLKVLHISGAKIISETELPWTLDGEYGGKHRRVDIEVRRRALSLCI